MSNLGELENQANVYQILPKAGADKILDGALALLEDFGVKFEQHDRAMKLFAEAGCDISDEGIVKFPRQLVKNCMDSVAKSCRIWNRAGDDYREINGEDITFFAGITAVAILDEVTQERRDTTHSDVVKMTRLADALPNIDGVALPCKMTEQADSTGEIQEFVTLLKNTSKPLMYLCEDSHSLKTAIEIASLIRGGKEALAEKPYFKHLVTPLPLQYPAGHVDQIFMLAEHGIPFTITTGVFGGGTGPITIAANVLYCMATDLAGIVLSQLIRENCFCVAGSMPLFLDMRSGCIGGLAEFYNAEAIRRQVYRDAGMVATNMAGCSIFAIEFNQMAVAEITANLLQSIYINGGECNYTGGLEAGLSFSPHALVYANELIGFLRHVKKEVPCDEDHLALDVIKQVGHGGDFMSARHTMTHCRDAWSSKIFKGTNNETWDKEGRKDIVDLVSEQLLSLMESHQPEPLNTELERQIDTLLDQALAF